MRALFIVLSLPLMLAATDAPKPAKPTVKPLCQPRDTTPVQGRLDKRRDTAPRRLSDLPPARQMLAVVRTVDGCDVPTIVRENIGN